MKIATVFVATFLTWVAFDTDLFRQRGTDALSSRGAEEELALGSVERREKRRVLRKHRLDVIPRWARGERAPLRQRVNVNRSKDPRDSNQRMIRRKFTNM